MRMVGLVFGNILVFVGVVMIGGDLVPLFTQGSDAESNPILVLGGAIIGMLGNIIADGSSPEMTDDEHLSP